MGTREPAFGVNNFGNAKVFNASESIAQELAMFVLNRPGYMPSMPQLGMGIQDMLYGFFDEISETAIENELARQCPAFASYVTAGTISCTKQTINGSNILVIAMPVTVESVSYRLVFNFRNTPDGEVVYDFYYDDNDDSQTYTTI